MLVALVLFSTGMLAVAALHVVARGSVAEAAQRTLAARLAQDLVDHMRSNSTPEALAAYAASASPWPERFAGRQRLARSIDAAGCRHDAPCSEPRRAAARDLIDWEQAMDGAAEQVDLAPVGGLTYPTACVSGPAGGGSGIYTVTIAWRGRFALSQPAAGSCGRDASGLGIAAPRGTRLYGDGDRYRRTLTVTAYIAARA